MIWFSKSAVSVSGSFVADGKFLLMIFCSGPKYPSLTPCKIILRIVSR